MPYRPYIPSHVTQVDGTPSQWTNCWAAVGAWLARGATRTKRRPTPNRFRKWAARPASSMGGLADLQRGLQAKQLWKQGALRSNVPRDRIEKRFRRQSGRLYAAESAFSEYPDVAKCQEGFDGYHMIGVVAGEGTGENLGKVRVMDPLCGKIQWVSIDGVVDAVIQYNNEHRGEKRDTADLVVLTVPPRVGSDVPKDSPAEPPDMPEPEPEPIACDEAEVARLLERYKGLLEICQEDPASEECDADEAAIVLERLREQFEACTG